MSTYDSLVTSWEMFQLSTFLEVEQLLRENHRTSLADRVKLIKDELVVTIADRCVDHIISSAKE